MSFLWPILLWSLLLIPVLIWLYLRMQRRRQQLALRYGSLGLVQQASGRSIGMRRHIPAILFLIGLTILFLALGRPQMVLGLPKVEGIVILAFDVSGSMAAEDFAPNRLDAAKAVAKDFVARQPSTVQIGVVEFSDSGFSAQLPSSDQATILKAIDHLKVQKGTSLAQGIIVALNTIATVTGDQPITNGPGDGPNASLPTPTPAPAKQADNSAVIVLLTDGENNMNPDPMVAAQYAVQRGVRIHTIAIGSPEGIQLTVNGFTVFTKVDEAMLKNIADTTGGSYFNAQNEDDLRTVYESIEPRLQIKQEETEVTSIFAGASILILLTGGALSLFWFNRVP